MNNHINKVAQLYIDRIEEACKIIKPKVAIRCITFNHEKYLRDCLDGFINQKTNFPFIAIVHEDASTDGTASILKEYAEKYPNIIFPIFEQENMYSKRNGSIARIMAEAIRVSTAEYIAMCEGDDYWTDLNKLQKQFDFLKDNPDYSMVFATPQYLYEDGRTDIPFILEDREYSSSEIYGHFICNTPTVMFKNDVYKLPIYKELCSLKNTVFGDITTFLCCCALGKIYGSSDVVCNFRRLSTGASKYISKHPYELMMNRLAISKRMGKELIDIDKITFVPLFVRAIQNLNNSEYRKIAYELFKLSPWGCIKQLRHFFNSRFINYVP